MNQTSKKLYFSYFRLTEELKSEEHQLKIVKSEPTNDQLDSELEKLQEQNKELKDA